MSNSLIGLETSLFDMTQASGTLVDSINGRNAEIIDGTPDFTGEYIEMDAVLARIRWHPSLSPIDTANDYSYYTALTFPGSLNGIINSIMTGGGARMSPLFWDDNSFTNAIRFSPNAGGSEPAQGIGLGAEVNDPVEIGIGVSYTASTDTMRMAVKTSKGFLGTTTYTHGANPPTNNFFYLGWTASGYGLVRFFDLGFLTSAKPLQDLVDTVEELTPTISKGLILPAIPRFITPMIPRFC